jgi:membrane protein DedA with SNARE-associated domain
MDVIFSWIAQYGYVALLGLLMLGIVGLPIPDETLLTFAGYLVFKQDSCLFQRRWPPFREAFLVSRSVMV